MICATCYGLLRGQQGRQWRGTYELHFAHHTKWDMLMASAGMGCCICEILHDGLKYSVRRMLNGGHIQAFLSEIGSRPGSYRLDFRTTESPRLATFLLQDIRHENEAQIYTPTASTTESPEVLQLARHWIDICTGPSHPTCPDDDFGGNDRKYPTRMLELPPYDWTPHSHREAKVYLVDGGSQIKPYVSPSVKQPSQQTNGTSTPLPIEYKPSPTPHGHYVTLSHCWGDARFFRLLEETEEKMRAGINLTTLPKTFSEVIHFVRRLRVDIRYIWIDALCIFQDSAEDWNAESVKMYSVYRNSFCNISATAASNSSGGIFFERNPQRLWETDVNLNTDGIPAMIPQKSRGMLGIEPMVQRCRIQDASFWRRLVDDAPVNKRAWVLQERLLAPRVLHFCEDQVAWECRHLDAAESLPHGVSSLQVVGGEVRDRERLKSLLPQKHGSFELAPNLADRSRAAHEYWKRIVERYSTTAITKEKDRLIALAGIAEAVSHAIGPKVAYIAGLWENWLASQLLWHVEPHYNGEKVLLQGRRPRQSDHPDDYVAPSFSWASLNPGTSGIRCGQTVPEDDMYISVESFFLQPTPENERFGKVKKGCHIVIWGALHPIEIRWDMESGHDNYQWWLRGDSNRKSKGLNYLFLDSPDDDGVRKLTYNAFCVPAYRDSEGYIICLVLTELKDAYKRIGLAIVPNYEAEHVDGLTRGRSPSPRNSPVMPEGEEMEQLKRENQRLREEIERLQSPLVQPPNGQVNGHTSGSNGGINRSSTVGGVGGPALTKIRLE